MFTNHWSGGGGGGGYKLGLLRGYNQFLFCFCFSPELGCFECSLRCFLLLYVHIFMLFFLGGGGGGDQNIKIKGKSPSQEFYIFLYIETCSRNMFTSFVDINLSPAKLARYTNKIFFLYMYNK